MIILSILNIEEIIKKRYKNVGLYSYLDITVAMQFNNMKCELIDNNKSMVFNSGLVDHEMKDDIYLIIDVDQNDIDTQNGP